MANGRVEEVVQAVDFRARRSFGEAQVFVFVHNLPNPAAEMTTSRCDENRPKHECGTPLGLHIARACGLYSTQMVSLHAPRMEDSHRNIGGNWSDLSFDPLQGTLRRGKITRV